MTDLSMSIFVVGEEAYFKNSSSISNLLRSLEQENFLPVSSFIKPSCFQSEDPDIYTSEYS